MSQKAAKAQEPSMEEILASIRRIISDDSGADKHEASRAAAPAPVPPPLAPARSAPSNPPPPPLPSLPRATEEPDVLELTEMVEARAEPVLRPVQDPDVEFRDYARRRPEPEPPTASLPARAYPDRIDDQLLSQRASEAVSAAFGSLANTMFEGSRSIDDVVREMLRPMLKTWLEDNLPSLVERLVRAEIERVSRGGR
jgi:uncharacterized protein